MPKKKGNEKPLSGEALVKEVNRRIRLAAQRALLGQVPPALRAVSVEAFHGVASFRAIFESAPDAHERELISIAAAEFIADFPADFRLEEEVLVSPAEAAMSHLSHLVFLRDEGRPEKA